ncbi:MAG TPA: hypothetical protein DDZ42_17205 [Candidatus Rokubacteria bacterium]|nr:MAG: hypothetical protein A2050_03165 [Candidatus Rokubacteria bacterium GWA2_73_35]HBH03630.1 hypothetical protein [Candidatus Rokubacteria bacterium]
MGTIWLWLYWCSKCGSTRAYTNTRPEGNVAWDREACGFCGAPLIRLENPKAARRRHSRRQLSFGWE